MNSFLLALPPEWKRRLDEILRRRGHLPVVMECFDREAEIFENDDPAIVILPAGDSTETVLRFCRRLRDRHPSPKLQILICASAAPDKESWPAFQQSGMDAILPASFTDSELEFRIVIAECKILNPSPTGDVSPPPDQIIDFTPDTENVPYGLFHSSLDNRFLKVNDGLVNILGYSSKEELMQVDMARDIYLDPNERARLVATVPRQNKLVESVWKRRDGTPVALQLSGHWIVDETRHTAFLQGIAWDVTEQKRSQEMQRIQHDLAIALSHVSSLQETLDLILDTMMCIDGVDCGGIYLVDRETRAQYLAANRNLSPKFAETVSLATPDMPQVQFSEQGISHYFNFTEFEPAMIALCRLEGIESVAVVPVLFDDRVIAVLNLASCTLKEFPQTLRLAIESIAMHIGGSIARVQAEESLRESENRYRLLADNASDVVWSAHWSLPDLSNGLLSVAEPKALVETLLRGWRFDYMSPSLEKVLGYRPDESMADTPVTHMDPAWYPAVAKILLDNLVEQAPSQIFEFPMHTKDGSLRWCEVVVNILGTEPDRSLRMMGILRDITSRHEAQEALRKSETQLRVLFENLPDFVILLDQNATIRFVNHGAPGAAAESLIGAHGFSFLHESSLPQCREAFAKALSSNVTQNVEAIDMFGNSWSCRIVPMLMEGTLDHVMIICTDITAEKQASQAVREEQQLLRRMIDLQEREKRFLSYEIHDGFAQQITGALFHLEAFKRLRETDKTTAEKNLNQTCAMLSRSIDETRRLISGLRPPILDEAGVLAAVEYLICEHRERCGIDIMFKHNLQAMHLAPPLESAIFRIVQESLTNACRHSGSDFIRVELNELEGRLQIVVFDEGAGFDLAAVPEDRFGLRSVRERARLLGGTAEIQSAPGDGCCIRVELPLVQAME